MNVEQDEEMATDDSSSPDDEVVEMNMEVVNPSPQRTQPRSKTRPRQQLLQSFYITS